MCSISVTDRSRASSSVKNAKNLVSKLLWFELLITVILDTANELLGIVGVPLVLGQVVRACFVVLNLLVVFEFGEKRESQVVVLIYIFFALMVLREVDLGIGGIAYAAVYWAKFLLYVSTFFAVKCAGTAGGLEIEAVEKFFRWSIVFIAPAFLLLAMMGLLEQSTFDSGFEGAILSKNSMSATLLLLFAISLFFAFENKTSFLWTVVIAAALFLLGSKATIAFAVVVIVASALHEMRRLAPRGLLTLALLVAGVCIALWLYRDSVILVIDSQLQRYRFVMNQGGGSFIDYLLTGRNDLLDAGISYFLSDITPITLIVGSGISSLSHGVADIVNAATAYRGVEMDVFEIALASGAAGVLVALSPLVMSMCSLRNNRTPNSFYLVIGALVMLCFMVLGGHVVTEGMPAAYLGIFLAYICLIRKSDINCQKLSSSSAMVDGGVREQ